MEGLEFGDGTSKSFNRLKAGVNPGFVFMGFQAQDTVTGVTYFVEFKKVLNDKEEIKKKYVNRLFAGWKDKLKTDEQVKNAIKHHANTWAPFVADLCGEETGDYIFQLYKGLVGVDGFTCAVEGFQGLTVFDFDPDQRQPILDAFYELLVDSIITCLNEKIGTTGNLLLHFVKSNTSNKEYLNIPEMGWMYAKGYNDYQSFFSEGDIEVNSKSLKLTPTIVNKETEDGHATPNASTDNPDDGLPF